MSKATTQTVRHPGQWTSRFVESPSSERLNVTQRGLLHRGQLKFSPPTVIGSLDGPGHLKAACGPGRFMQVTPLRTRRCCSKKSFFFQAEDGIRDYKVTGVQTCALPI